MNVDLFYYGRLDKKTVSKASMRKINKNELVELNSKRERRGENILICKDDDFVAYYLVTNQAN